MQTARKTLYLIDASSYIYRAFHALPPLNSPDGTPTNALYGVTTMLLKLLRETEPEYLAAVFDAPGPTFRDAMYTEYKANRPSMPDDLSVQIPMVHELVDAFAIAAVTLPGVEADDVIATIARHAEREGVDTIIITGDKDLMQLVTPHIQLWDTMRNRRYDTAAVRSRLGVEPRQVADLLGLMGDAVDNVPGVRGIGEKTATTLLQRFDSLDNLLQQLDELEKSTDIRGAKKLAATLREHTEIARLSRDLATLRDDVAVDCEIDHFHYPSFKSETLRPLFLRYGFQRLLAEVQTRSAAAIDTQATAVVAAEDITRFHAAARAGGCVGIAVDGEGAVLADATGAVVGLDAAQLPLLREILADPTIEKVAHDLKSELWALRAHGIEASQPAFDVMIASYLLEATPTHRLEDLATDVLSVNLGKFRGARADLANGVSVLPALRKAMAARIEENGLHQLFYELEMPLVPVLARMEQRGICLDREAFAEMSTDMEARMATLMKEIYALAGGEFNILSPAQLREILFERLGLSTRGVRRGKTGLSTDVDVLTRLAADHPLPAKILDYRGLAKLKSTYVDALPAAIDPTTGRLHTRFNQTVAATGRLSSSDPNLQNIPIRGADGQRIRAAFIAAPGCVLLSADYSQIELRLLAHLSQDSGLLVAFRDDEDIHSRTAAEVFGVLPGTVGADMRRTAKVINFGILYGMGSQSLARELGIPVKDAELYIRHYFDRYPAVRAYLDRSREEAKERGFAMTLLGRRRTVRDLSSRDRGLVQAAERIAINTPIQGSAADVIKAAMVAIDRRVSSEGLRAAMLLQVHDELVFEIAQGEVDHCRQVIRDEMEGVLPLSVPLKVDIGVGSNWADAH